MSRPTTPDPTLLQDPNPTTRGTGRRMTIYYQDIGSEPNSPPVAPKLDESVDIAKPIIDEVVAYTVAQVNSVNNPIQGTLDRGIQYLSADPDKNYSKIADADKIFFQKDLAQTLFDNDALRGAGVEQQDNFGAITNPSYGVNVGDVRRPFLIKKYIQPLNVLPTPSPEPRDDNQNTKHGRLIDNMLLKTRGQNSFNRLVTPSGTPTAEREGQIKLGHFFYNGLGQYANSSYVNESSVKSKTLTVDDLKQLAMNTVFNAVLPDSDYKVEATAESATGAEGVMATPWGPRVGVKTNLGRFSTAREVQKVFGLSRPNQLNFIETDDDVSTYGSFYNVYSQFDSLVSVGQITVAIAMMLTFVLLLEGVYGGFLLIQKARKKINGGRDPLPEDEISFKDIASPKDKQALLGKSSEGNNGAQYPNNNINGADFLENLLDVGNVVPATKHPYFDCYNAGIEEFFGFQISGGGVASAGQQALAASLKVLTENGRMNNILREILRDTIEKIGGADAQSLFSGKGGEPGISGITNYVRKILNLKIIKFTTTLVQIGDRVLYEKNIRAYAESRAMNGAPLDGGGSNVSYVDNLPSTPQYYIGKSRLSMPNGPWDGHLAWSANTSPYFGLPLDKLNVLSRNTTTGQTTLSEAGVAIQQPPTLEGYGNTEADILDRTEATRNGRNSYERIKQWEDRLEMDYMPFYFHDLRTNEIMAFHAFLENVSEDFQVEYNSQEFYGRMDKVHVYKHTSRTISVDFKVVATSPDDHDQMWYKINRLAMMIYPQWTRGREVSVGNTENAVKFIQPFSQIPGATPVIRLRLGDMFKSNYSKMAVARLFGATTYEQYNVNGSTETTNRTAAVTPPAASSTTPASGATATGGATTPPNPLLDRVRNLKPINSLFPAHRPFFTANTSTIIFLADGVSRYLKNYNYTPVASGHSPNDRVTARYVETTRHGIRVQFQSLSTRLPANPNPDVPQEQNNSAPQTIAINLQRTTPGSDVIPFNVINKVVDRNATIGLLLMELTNPPSGPSPAAAGGASGAANPNAQADASRNTINAADFYNEDRNPILKSFKSTAGRGLAGVITSFKVDYGEAKGKWGTEGTSKLRAPMFVTVQIQMAVIHDIPLGLDSDGIMNAPIWPVGNSSNFFTNNSSIGAGTQTTPRSGGGGGAETAGGSNGTSPLDYFDPGSNPYTIAKTVKNSRK